MRRLVLVVCALIVWFTGVPVKASAALETPWLTPPVDGAVVRGFQPPTSRWGPGHRGLDYAVSRGGDVRAAADGPVAFAGTVAGSAAVTIAHQGGLETTYSRLSEVFVERGEVVAQGQFIGRVGNSHPGTDGGLHFGVKLDDAYVDPRLYLGPLDVGDAIHLVPTLDRALPFPARDFLGRQVEGSTVACTSMEEAALAGRPAVAPNDNLVVVVAGISSAYPGPGESEVDAVPQALGYPRDRVFR
jgi:Peptidase family M23